MGDNANNNWQWHNTEIGSGYQAKFVVRQPGMNSGGMKIVDMTGHIVTGITNPVKDDKNLNLLKRDYNDDNPNTHQNDVDISRKKEKHSKGHKTEKKEKKQKKQKNDKHTKDRHTKTKQEDDLSMSTNDDEDSYERVKDQLSYVSPYNPLLQLFVSKLSDDLTS